MEVESISGYRGKARRVETEAQSGHKIEVLNLLKGRHPRYFFYLSKEDLKYLERDESNSSCS